MSRLTAMLRAISKVAAGGGGGGGGSFTTWSSTDKTAGWTTSNGDLTADANNNVREQIRSVAGKTSGKFYCEFTLDILAVANDLFFGLRKQSDVLANTQSFSSGGNVVYTRGSGSVFSGGTLTAAGSAPSYVAGDKLIFAIDFDNKKAWLGKNGTYSAGNPALGTSPSYTWTETGAICVYMETDNSGGEDKITANFGATAFTYTPPSGFTAGFTA